MDFTMTKASERGAGKVKKKCNLGNVQKMFKYVSTRLRRFKIFCRSYFDSIFAKLFLMIFLVLSSKQSFRNYFNS